MGRGIAKHAEKKKALNPVLSKPALGRSLPRLLN